MILLLIAGNGQVQFVHLRLRLTPWKKKRDLELLLLLNPRLMTFCVESLVFASQLRVAKRVKPSALVIEDSMYVLVNTVWSAGTVASLTCLFIPVDYQWLTFDIVVADFDRAIQIYRTMGNVPKNLWETKQVGFFLLQSKLSQSSPSWACVSSSRCFGLGAFAYTRDNFWWNWHAQDNTYTPEAHILDQL
jgi:hypothetical protein